MLMKMTYPKGGAPDTYVETKYANFSGTIDVDTGRVKFEMDVDLDFDPVGLEIFLLDSQTGKTVDRVKWGVSKHV
jgi:hypothetical protein